MINRVMTCHLLQNIFFREFATFVRETSHFRDIEMFCFREIMLPLKYVIELLHFRKIEMCHFREIEISHFGEITILQFLGD